MRGIGAVQHPAIHIELGLNHGSNQLGGSPFHLACPTTTTAIARGVGCCGGTTRVIRVRVEEQPPVAADRERIARSMVRTSSPERIVQPVVRRAGIEIFESMVQGQRERVGWSEQGLNPVVVRLLRSVELGRVGLGLVQQKREERCQVALERVLQWRER